ncbi:hypothetical protein VST7929_02497 [Vibrio stylophorae]|uniref:UPF0270 protein VST7929_02497 n=1 Tax=Vibrio stylophorae TaxID=659351 RepID=A0ABM8ZW31_9VIBR|nr:YheU family protein [Vibrio stylophorae]CAH0534553.1 hypothetical protein VST7929_02497 [Vibrio stylophorae]
MIIPWQQLDPETLRNVVESVILREGTDYGDSELSLDEKVDLVLAQLAHGDAVLVYSELHESVDIKSKQHFQQSI